MAPSLQVQKRGKRRKRNNKFKVDSGEPGPSGTMAEVSTMNLPGKIKKAKRKRKGSEVELGTIQGGSPMRKAVLKCDSASGLVQSHRTSGEMKLSTSGLTKLQEQMLQRLEGSHFRMLNEKLYTTAGKESFIDFSADPSLFHTVPSASASLTVSVSRGFPTSSGAVADESSRRFYSQIICASLLDSR